MRPSPRKIRSRRAAFTLVELLVAITIIALLIGLLVPAVMSVRRNAQIAEVQTDIGEIETGLTNFKTQYGDFPPSRITLYNSAAGWNGDKRSKTIIRKYWPQFNFASGGGGSFYGSSGSVTLDGSECLLFFLGGVRDGSGAFIGFSKNPALPFSTSGKSRTGPFLEVETSRVIDTDGDGNMEYKDVLSGSTQPYVYYSSYEGRGYESDDHTAYGAGKPTFYTEGTGSKAWKSQSFQIISAGPDGNFGPGGAYAPEASNALPGSGRDVESDNITNFSGGTLQ